MSFRGFCSISLSCSRSASAASSVTTSESSCSASKGTRSIELVLSPLSQPPIALTREDATAGSGHKSVSLISFDDGFFFTDAKKSGNFVMYSAINPTAAELNSHPLCDLRE